MQTLEFLKTVITTPAGNFCLATAGNGGNKWAEHWFDWPSQALDIIHTAEQLQDTYNIYFSAHLFNERRALKSAVLPTRTIQADLDSADVFSLPITPTILVKTSDDRHQGYWIIQENADSTAGVAVPNNDLEQFSRRLTYAIPDCDVTGWPLGHRVRLPNTSNYKYRVAPTIKVISFASKRLDPTTFELLPHLDEVSSGGNSATTEAEATATEEWINKPHIDSPEVPPVELVNILAKEGKISSTCKVQFTHATKDRSASLWRLMCELFNAGVERDLVYWLASNSTNNKFAERRYGGVRDLRKDILRAEKHTTNHSVDIVSVVNTIRRNTALQMHDRKEQILKAILEYLKTLGTFVHGSDDQPYFVRSSTGRPIIIQPKNQEIAALLTALGINSASEEYTYVVHGLRAYIINIQARTTVSSLAHFDTHSKVVSVHTGSKDIINITADSLYTTPNGSSDLLFTWAAMSDTFAPSKEPLPNNQTWQSFMFDTSIEAALNMPIASARTILAVWTMYTIFRSQLSRPVLAIFGVPGSGKSTLFRLIYRLMYGRYKNLQHITNEDNFDLTIAMNPLVVFDNVDNWTPWLANKLALSTSSVLTERRTLYTDTDTTILQNQAMIGITAHSPKFVREDVADRLIVINIPRRSSFTEESQLFARVSRARPQLWGLIIKDIQRILSLPKPNPSEVPQFRMQDFATYGLWIARGMNIETEFLDAIKSTKSTQNDLVLEAEQLLITAIDRLITRYPMTQPHGTGDLFLKLAEASESPPLFNKVYKSPIVLGRKLWLLAGTLKTVFKVDIKITATGARLWQFSKLETTTTINNKKEGSQ